MEFQICREGKRKGESLKFKFKLIKSEKITMGWSKFIGRKERLGAFNQN